MNIFSMPKVTTRRKAVDMASSLVRPLVLDTTHGSVLYLEDVSVSFDGFKALNNLSLDISEGELRCIIGPNGAGKTTLFRMIMGEEKPNSGEFKVGPTVKISYVDQNHKELDPNKTVYDVLSGGLDNITLGGKPMNARAYISRFNFGGSDQGKKVSVLSGGERRRTEIARALASDPKFILLDEPFAGIDPIAVEDIQHIVEKLKNKNIGILITDHNVQETLSITDRAYLLFEGKILKQGTAQELASDEQVRKVYLGQNFELKKK